MSMAVIDHITSDSELMNQNVASHCLRAIPYPGSSHSISLLESRPKDKIQCGSKLSSKKTRITLLVAASASLVVTTYSWFRMSLTIAVASLFFGVRENQTRRAMSATMQGLELSRPQTPVLSNQSSFSTPILKNSTTDKRANNLWEYSRIHSKIWEEPKGQSKLIEFITSLGKQSAVPSILESKEYSDFVASCGRGTSNESQFHAHYKKEHFDESASTNIALKPDFFTAKVMQDKQSQKYKPDSLYVPSQSTCTPQDTKHPVQEEKSPLLQPLLLKSENCFGFEDVRSLWELKSSTAEINITKWLKNLQFMAAEVLRFQFYRQYIIGFLVAGVKIRVAVFSREGQFLGTPVDYTNGTELLVCLVADLTASETELGFPPERFLSYSNLTQHFTVSVPSIRNKMIPFELLEQKIWPRKDCLLGLGTTIHTAKKPDSDKIYALKMSSPYSSRPHEGIAIHRLEKVSEVARIEAYVDWPKSDFQQLLYDIEWTTPMPATIISRSFRLTVTEWLPIGLLDYKSLNLLDYLTVWRKLYIAVAHIAEQGILHRDLTFGNVRLSRPRINDVDDLEVKLIDFDLFDEVDKIGQGGASADRAGTTLFMPIEMLGSSSPSPRHEQHEDETAFWVGALAIFHR
ncbi:hypothetical protein MMC31_005518 [Peltigera leucophlebia]|nr:hypothetical protein [Peltigera leucophlebia]